MTNKASWRAVPFAASSPDDLVAGMSQWAADSRWMRSASDGNDPDRPYRSVILAQDLRAAKLLAAEFVAGRRAKGLVSGKALDRPRLGFLFSGQGAQFQGMGAGLYAGSVAFREGFEDARRAVDPTDALGLVGWTRPQHPGGDAKTEFQRGVLGTFCVSCGLQEVLRTWSIQPDATLGFSSGEYAAAAAAGLVSPQEAGEQLARQTEDVAQVTDGRMLVVPTTPEQVTSLMEQVGGPIGVSAVLAPDLVTVAGSASAVARLVELLPPELRSRVRQLPVPQALHSPAQDGAGEAMARDVPATAPVSQAAATFYSTVSGAAMDRLPPGHWARQTTGTVQFAQAVQALAPDERTILLEVGPGRALIGLCSRLAPERTPVIAALGKATDDVRAILEAVALLYCAGIDVSLARVQGTLA